MSRMPGRCRKAGLSQGKLLERPRYESYGRRLEQMMSKSSLKAAGGSITTCQRSSRERLGMVAGVDSDKNGWSCCLRVKTAQSMLRPLIRNSMPGAGCNRRNCPRSPSLSSVVSTSAFLQSFPRYSETRGLERYPERSPAIATHRHGRSFIQNWAHLEI